MQTSTDIDQLAAALVAFNKQVKNPAADQVANTGEYSYAYPDFAAVVDADRPLLASHGLSVLQGTAVSGDLIGIATTILHESGQWILLDPAFVPAGGEVQDFGAAISYSRRYSYFAALNLVATEDHAPPAQQRKAGPGPSTAAQQKKIHICAYQAGVTDEELAAVLTRRYKATSTKELTKEQASDLIERLMSEKQRRDEAAAAGADPETGEVEEEEEIGFEEGPPGMDAEEYRESRL